MAPPAVRAAQPGRDPRAGQADRHVHQRLTDQAARAAAYAARWERHVAELDQESQLRRDMPAADRAAEDRARAELAQQAEREAARVAAQRRTLDYGWHGPNRGHGIER